MNILFINYIDDSKLESGSSVRPVRMLDSFIESGNNIVVLSGNQNDKYRKLKARKIKELISSNGVDICYIESPTSPIINHYDRALLYELKKHHIPTGYFYRDFYRKFPEQFPRRNGIVGRMKEFVLDILQFLTDRAIKNCDVVYFPSIEATELFEYKYMSALPPACQYKFQEKKKLNKVGIYVGGISAPYNITPLLEAYSKLNQDDSEYKLIIVCREKEWRKFESMYKNAHWLQVYHASGEQLVPLYNEASVSFVMPDSTFLYNNFAVSVKTFEYASYGLPVIGVDCKALKSIIEENSFGFSGPDTADFFERSIKQVLSDETNYNQIRTKMLESILSKNLWKHRVNKVISDLSRR